MASGRRVMAWDREAEERQRQDQRQQRQQRNYNGGGGRHGGGGGYRGGRGGGRGPPPVDPQVEWNTRIKGLLILPGDFSKRLASSESLAKNVVIIIGVLEQDAVFDGGAQMAAVAALMVEAAASLGMQSPVYALMTALCATKGGAPEGEEAKYESEQAAAAAEEKKPFGRLVVDGVCAELSAALKSGAFLRVKLLVRFLGELVSCNLISAQEFGWVLTSLVDSYVCGNGVLQPCADVIAGIVITALAWSGPVLHDRRKRVLDELMEKIGTHMARRSPLFEKRGLRAIFYVGEEEDDDSDDSDDEGMGGAGGQQAEPLTDSMAALWDEVSALHRVGWTDQAMACLSVTIPRPYHDETAPYKETTVADAIAAVVALPLPTDVLSMEGVPALVKRMGPFAATACMQIKEGARAFRAHPEEHVTPSHSLAYAYTLGAFGEFELFHEGSGGGAALCAQLPTLQRLLLLEYVKEVITAFQPRINGDGTSVGKHEALAAQLLAIGKVAPREEAGVYIVVETLLQMVISLPQPPHMTAMLHRTLLELCRLAPNEVAPAISSATGALYHELPRMDFHSRRQLALWFANHLKDTEFKWPFWQHWAGVLQEQRDHPQRMFVEMALDMLVRLSYRDRIKNELPEAMWDLLPPQPSIINPYDTAAGELPASVLEVIQALVPMVAAKEHPDNLSQWFELQLSTIDAADAEAAGGGAWSAAALTYAILAAGAPSPTHLTQCLDRYLKLVKANNHECGDEAAQAAALHTVATAWAGSPQAMVAATRLLLRRGAVSPEAVVTHFFAPANVDKLGWYAPLWELLEAALQLALDAVEMAVAQSETDETAAAAAGDAMVDDDDDADDYVTEAVRSLQELSRHTVESFVTTLDSAVEQYRGAGVDDPYTDPWWVATTSHFKAAVRMLLSAPLAPSAELVGAGGEGGKVMAAALRGDAFECARGRSPHVLAIVRPMETALAATQAAAAEA
eukprot:TRINITY_DN14488_c0_g1_i1.p1 TRINITY_DN14488_c0_g1~~TRINITY_DN14488_c0_g1_i1.p1  ORF type:complete len:968 (+),score=324.05 TRINITY_DN14488_c0_g1_i1:151-3054(+)